MAEVTIHCPAVDGVPSDQVIEFWAVHFEDIQHSIQFWDDGNYTVKIDEEHQDTVFFFVDNDNIADWHNARPDSV